jgi:hypothetical protein
VTDRKIPPSTNEIVLPASGLTCDFAGFPPDPKIPAVLYFAISKNNCIFAALNLSRILDKFVTKTKDKMTCNQLIIK